MDQPKVSIIMGVYNCENTLEEAITAIESQTYSNWEFIICDDGSSDKTYEIAYSYLKKEPNKFVVLKNDKNMGLNYTLNRCLEVATGKYVARMDGDDTCAPERFEKQVEFLEKNPQFALVGTEMSLYDENGEWGKCSVIKNPEIKHFCKYAPFFCHASVMIRRDVFLSVEGYTVKKQLLRVEDCHLWYKIYAKGYKGANLTEPLYNMRDDRNAFSRRTFSARMHGIYVTWVGFKMVKMPWYKYFYAIKTTLGEFIKAILPMWIYKILHRRKTAKKKI